MEEGRPAATCKPSLQHAEERRNISSCYLCMKEENHRQNGGERGEISAKGITWASLKRMFRLYLPAKKASNIGIVRRQ